MKTWSTVVGAISLSLVVACSSTSDGSSSPGASSSSGTLGSSSGSSGSSGSGATRTSWAIGTWFSPEYNNGAGKSVPPKGLGINADGTYVQNVSGVESDKGTWTMSGDTVTLSGPNTKLDRGVNCTFMNFDDGDNIDTYYRDDYPSACPDKPPALTAAEKCLVGEFKETRDYSSSSSIFKTTRKEYRTMIFDQISVGNGDTFTTAVYYWEIKGGELCTQGVNRQSLCEKLDWPRMTAGRTGAVVPGCVQP